MNLFYDSMCALSFMHPTEDHACRSMTLAASPFVCDLQISHILNTVLPHETLRRLGSDCVVQFRASRAGSADMP